MIKRALIIVGALYVLLLIFHVNNSCIKNQQQQIAFNNTLVQYSEMLLTRVERVYLHDQQVIIDSSDTDTREEAEKRLEELDNQWLPVFVAYESLRATHDAWLDGETVSVILLLQAYCKLENISVKVSPSTFKTTGLCL